MLLSTTTRESSWLFDEFFKGFQTAAETCSERAPNSRWRACFLDVGWVVRPGSPFVALFRLDLARIDKKSTSKHQRWKTHSSTV